MTPGRERPPAAEPGADLNGGVEAQRSVCRVPAPGDTERYLAGRERILGHRLNLSRDPELAAGQLAEQLGGRTFAHRWAAALLKAST